MSHSETLERFADYSQKEKENRDNALDDLMFLAGKQWTDEDILARKAEKRPMLTINHMGKFVRAITGPLRQSAPSIQPMPVDDKTDPVTSSIMAGLIRQIEYQSGASSVYAWGAGCSVACGIGHWQIGTKYCDDSFDQEITIKRIVDPLAVVWDSNAFELDRSDAYECFVSEWISKQAYMRDYKDTGVPSDFPSAASGTGASYWREGDLIRIASRWFKRPVKKRLGQTQDGRVFDITAWPRERVALEGIVKERVADSYEVMHEKLSGDGVLSDPEKWAGRHIPIIPVIGEEISIDGKVYRHGIVRFAKDPNRLYNYWRSASAEVISLAPKAPYIGTVAMFSGLEEQWRRANSTNTPFLAFNPDPEMPGMRPERQAPPAPPSALWQEAQIAQEDEKGVTGIFDAALGAQSNETSGVAINARKSQSNDGTFVYYDNFNHSIRRTGQVLIDLIPKIYDGERIVRILGDDGEISFAPINKTMMTADGPVLVNDLSAAKYDVRIKTGPSYASARAEGKEQLSNILAANPAMMNVIGDLYFENQDFPGAKEIAARLKKMLPPQLADGGEQQPDPVSEAVQRANMVGLEADIRSKQAKADKQVMENQQLAERLGL